MKFCPKCKEDKEETHFSSRGGGKLTSYCKTCQRTYSNNHYIENKDKHNKKRYQRTKVVRKEHAAKIKALKDNQSCTDCGVPYPHYVLEFDHLSDKVANISEMAGKCSWIKIQKEIDKCELVCSNCHRERTHKRKTEYS